MSNLPSKSAFVEAADDESKVIRHIDDGTDRSLSSKLNARSQIESDIEAFLQNGGEVDKIEPNVTADPPRKPVSNYGSRPI